MLSAVPTFMAALHSYPCGTIRRWRGDVNRCRPIARMRLTSAPPLVRDGAEQGGGRSVKFGNFQFPDCRDPARDGAVIDETVREAMLSDELGVDVVWLAEHHFDGIAVYADPIGLAGALRSRCGRPRSASPCCKPRCTTRSGW